MLRRLDFSVGSKPRITARRRNGIFSDNLPPELDFDLSNAGCSPAEIGTEVLPSTASRAGRVVDIEEKPDEKTGMQTENFWTEMPAFGAPVIICIEDAHLTRCKPFREESAMTFFSHRRFLAVYSGVLTVTFVASVLYGASAARIRPLTPFPCAASISLSLTEPCA